jgi:hypothetical protein
MSSRISVVVHDIAADGLPDMDELTGQVAFVWDGHVIHGWPLIRGPKESRWEDFNGVPYRGVTHWLEFPVPVWELTGG